MLGRLDPPVRLLSQVRVVSRCQTIRRLADIQLEHPSPSLKFGQWDVYPFLEPPLDGRIKLPWDVCSSKDEDTRVVVAHSLHLLCLSDLPSTEGDELT